MIFFSSKHLGNVIISPFRNKGIEISFGFSSQTQKFRWYIFVSPSFNRVFLPFSYIFRFSSPFFSFLHFFFFPLFFLCFSWIFFLGLKSYSSPLGGEVWIYFIPWKGQWQLESCSIRRLDMWMVFRLYLKFPFKLYSSLHMVSNLNVTNLKFY